MVKNGKMVKNPALMRGNQGSVPELGRFPGGRHGNALQHSSLENLHASVCRLCPFTVSWADVFLSLLHSCHPGSFLTNVGVEEGT